MKKLSLYIFVMLLLTTMVFASNVNIETKAVKNAISIDEEAEFDVYITNYGASDSFRVYYSGVEWYIKNEHFSLENQETKKLTVKAKPLYVDVGQYAIPLKIKADSDNKIEETNLIINVKDLIIDNYLPSLYVKTEFPKSINPNEGFDIKVTIKNKNPLVLEDLKLITQNDYFSKENVFSLNKTDNENVGEVIIENSFSLDNTIKAQNMGINFIILYNNKTIYSTLKLLEIKEFDPELNIKETKDGSLFKTIRTYNLSNIGNVEKSEQYKVKTSLFSELFTSTIPDSSLLKKDGSRYFVWDIELNPGEEQEIKVITNFRPFLLILLILTLLVVIYYILRSPLVITKHASVLKIEEGGISMLKVMINLKNISEKPISNVKIYDKIPHLAEYVREEHIGSLAPSKVLSDDNKGAKLMWEIPEFDGFEERIITYKIRTHLKILGGLTLPSTSGKFLNSRGKNLFAKSKDLKLILNNSNKE